MYVHVCVCVRVRVCPASALVYGERLELHTALHSWLCSQRSSLKATQWDPGSSLKALAWLPITSRVEASVRSRVCFDPAHVTSLCQGFLMAPDYLETLMKPGLLAQENPCMKQFCKMFRRTCGPPLWGPWGQKPSSAPITPWLAAALKSSLPKPALSWSPSPSFCSLRSSCPDASPSTGFIPPSLQPTGSSCHPGPSHLSTV